MIFIRVNKKCNNSGQFRASSRGKTEGVSLLRKK